jgi:hypothetical protein
MSIFWASIPIGLAIVAAAVGIPFWLTPRHAAGGPGRREAYLDAKDEMAQTADMGRRRRAFYRARDRRLWARQRDARPVGQSQSRGEGL